MAEPGRWRRRLRDKRVLVCIILVLGAVLVGGATLTIAAFTATSHSGGSISATDLVFDLAPPTTIVNTSGMKPGDTRSGAVTLTNTKARGSFTLGFSGLGTSTLASTLQLTVKRTSSTSSQTLYSGVLATAPTLDLGTLATGSALTLNLTFAWPADAQDPSLQGQSIPLVLQWNART